MPTSPPQPPAPDTADSGENIEQMALRYIRDYRYSNNDVKMHYIRKLIAAAVQAATAPLDNVKLVATAELPGEYTDPTSGKKLYNEALIQAAQVELLERLLQYNGAYIGIGGKRVENMVHHDVIKQELARLDGERRKGGGKDNE